jgi:hypothetical protein
MRRTIPFSVAVVVATVAVLGVMVGVGIGQTAGFHGGSPSDVYSLSERTPEGCAPIGVNSDGVGFMPLPVEIEEPSHLLAYFSFEWSGLESNEGGQVNPRLDAADLEAFPSRYTGNATGSFIGGTVMASFPNVGPGTHTVDVYAAVSAFGGVHRRLFASLESCVLNVFFIPAAQ